MLALPKGGKGVLTKKEHIYHITIFHITLNRTKEKLGFHRIHYDAW